LCIWMECQQCASNMKASSVMWVGRMLRGECQIPLWEMSWQKHELCTVQSVLKELNLSFHSQNASFEQYRAILPAGNVMMSVVDETNSATNSCQV
jgi:hypothetical protein